MTIQDFENLKDNRNDAESISEQMEQESRRYNRRFTEEERVKR